MRVLSKISWVAFMLPLLIWSCAPMDQPTIIPQTGSTLVSPAAGSSLVLLEASKGDSISFQVTPPDFGVPGAVEITYKLEMAKAGTNFAKVVALGTSKSPIIKVKTEDLNGKLLAEGLEAGKSAAVEFRVTTSINRSLSDLVGAASNLNVTPYLATVVLPSLRVPGDYQGWNPGNNSTIIYSANSDNIYEGFVHILSGSGEFKFITGPEWDKYPDYGTDAAPGKLIQKGGNIKIPGDFGTHRVKANLSALTYELVRIGVWGIIGDAVNGWDTEVPMSFNKDQNILTIDYALKVGKMKFRTNTWDHNYGLGSAPGEASAGGPDIPIAEAGNYTITLDFKTPGKVLYSITKK